MREGYVFSSENLFEKRFSDTFPKTFLKRKEETYFRKVFDTFRIISKIPFILTLEI